MPWRPPASSRSPSSARIREGEDDDEPDELRFRRLVRSRAAEARAQCAARVRSGGVRPPRAGDPRSAVAADPGRSHLADPSGRAAAAAGAARARPAGPGPAAPGPPAARPGVPLSAMLRAGLRFELDSPANLLAAAQRLTVTGDPAAFTAWCEYVRRPATTTIRGDTSRPATQPPTGCWAWPPWRARIPGRAPSPGPWRRCWRAPLTSRSSPAPPDRCPPPPVSRCRNCWSGRSTGTTECCSAAGPTSGCRGSWPTPPIATGCPGLDRIPTGGSACVGRCTRISSARRRSRTSASTSRC